MDEVKRLAQELGASELIKYDDWHGYTVYEPVYTELEYIGLPYIILVKDDEVRLSTIDETFEWLSEQPE